MIEAARRGLFEHYRARGTSTWVEVSGSSMRPSFGDGSWLLVDFGAREAKVGEVVLFPLGDTLVAHRVIRRRRTLRGWMLRTKGDACRGPDPPVASKDVLGVVRAVRSSRAVSPVAAAGYHTPKR
jgi:signal peptidase I